MPPLRDWLVDRTSSRPSACELADWFELEIPELHCEI